MASGILGIVALLKEGRTQIRLDFEESAQHTIRVHDANANRTWSLLNSVSRAAYHIGEFARVGSR